MVKLRSVGIPNKEWYTYSKVDQSDTLPYMWVGESVEGFIVH